MFERVAKMHAKGQLSPRERVTALAMHGAPRLAAGFKSFDYVNPDAPKGGELKIGRTGSFDNLNNLVVTGTPADDLDWLNDKLITDVMDKPMAGEETWVEPAPIVDRALAWTKSRVSQMNHRVSNLFLCSYSFNFAVSGVLTPVSTPVLLRFTRILVLTSE